VALEDHPVEHGQAASDPIAVKILERAHDAPPRRQRPAKSPAARPKGTGPASPDRHSLHQHQAAHWLRPSGAQRARLL
jgi:hypothetical protein